MLVCMLLTVIVLKNNRAEYWLSANLENECLINKLEHDEELATNFLPAISESINIH